MSNTKGKISEAKPEIIKEFEKPRKYPYHNEVAHLALITCMPANKELFLEKLCGKCHNSNQYFRGSLRQLQEELGGYSIRTIERWVKEFADFKIIFIEQIRYEKTRWGRIPIYRISLNFEGPSIAELQKREKQWNPYNFKPKTIKEKIKLWNRWNNQAIGKWGKEALSARFSRRSREKRELKKTFFRLWIERRLPPYLLDNLRIGERRSHFRVTDKGKKPRQKSWRIQNYTE